MNFYNEHERDPQGHSEDQGEGEKRPEQHAHPESHGKARGTAAMDVQTRQEVARKGGLAVSKNKQHMAEIGRRGGMAVSRNREHMAAIGRKGGEASRKGKAATPVQPGLTTQPASAPRPGAQRPGEEEAV
jgi:general stress protein YciG